MTQIQTIDAFVAAVATELGAVPAADRTEALRELTALLRDDAVRRGEAEAVEALGDPAAYAQEVRAALGTTAASDPAAPQGRVLGMPFDFRGASTERIGSRMWNPADPRIFTPRLFGVGWTVNFGALAVKLHLVRPDDFSDEAMARIPRWAANAALAVPAILATATVVLFATTWGRLPAEVPVHWNASGAPDGWAPKALALGGLLLISVLPTLIVVVRALARRTPTRDRVLASAGVALLALIGLGIGIITVADADGGSSGGWTVLVIVGSFVLSFLLLYAPSRLGLHAEWRDASRHEGEL